jgi:hypothetical protein
VVHQHAAAAGLAAAPASLLEAHLVRSKAGKGKQVQSGHIHLLAQRLQVCLKPTW